MQDSECGWRKRRRFSGKAGLRVMVAWLMMGLAPMNAELCCADPLESLRSNLPASIGQWKVEGEDRIYDRKGIFDYLDGAGEVYRAYNMERCLSRVFAGPQGARIILDVFDMGSPKDAYGVFTHDLDGEPIAIGQEGLDKAGWLRFWKHRFFVSVFDESQTQTSREAGKMLARVVSERIPEIGRKPDLLSRLPSAGLDQRSVRYLHDPVVLNSHFYVSDENILELGPETEAVLARYQREGRNAILLLVHYPDVGRAADAYRNFMKHYLPDADQEGMAQLEDRMWAAARLAETLTTIVLEADDREICRRLLMELLTPNPRK